MDDAALLLLGLQLHQFEPLVILLLQPVHFLLVAAGIRADGAGLDHPFHVGLIHLLPAQFSGELFRHGITLHQHVDFHLRHFGIVHVLEERLLCGQLAAQLAQLERA